jgi:hypothetical protein
MDKDKISYLADIATVCSQIRAMLNSTNTPKSSLQKLSAKVSYLDNLFIETLLESTVTTVDPGDDYNKKLQEARQQVVAKKVPQQVIPLTPIPVQNGLKKLAVEEPVSETAEESAEDESGAEDVEEGGFTLASLVSPKKAGRPKKNAK